MHLVSLHEQDVTVAGRTFHFARDEFLVTEHSHKYSPAEFHEMASQAGFFPTEAWTDPRGWFSVQLCTRR
jgi:uncharacterized SAM-dependent methyltransferase